MRLRHTLEDEKRGSSADCHCERSEAIFVFCRDCFVAGACPERSVAKSKGAPRNDSLVSSAPLFVQSFVSRLYSGFHMSASWERSHLGC
jgi:hypothetical protein